MSNFKQRVEEILSFTECEHDGRICSDMTLDKYEERPSCVECQTDRILAVHNAELDRIAEGMPKELFRASPPIIGAKDGGTQYAEDIGFNKGVIKSTAYIQAQKGS